MSKHRVIGFFALLFIVAISLALIQINHFGSITGFIVFNPLDEINGTMTNVTYSNGSILFVGSNLTGSYLSEVIDVGRIADWNNLSWQGDTDAVFYFRSCSSLTCTGSWNEVILDGFGNLSANNARYAQFLAEFSRNSGESFYVANISVDYTLLDLAPEVSIISPQHGAIYGDNASLSFNYSLSGENIDSCWYFLDNSSFDSDCEAFSLSLSNGEHTVVVYANNSIGLVGSDSSTFLVAQGYPTVVLDYPLDNSSTNQSLLGYYVEDPDLYYCELFADFSGVWDVSNNDSEPESGEINTFSSELEDGYYSWSVVCEDLEGNNAQGPNWTFNVDSVAPNVAISEPTGSYSSKKNIPLTLSVDDDNVVSCTYIVRDSSSSVVFSLSLAVCQNTRFNVAREDTYTIEITSVDSAGNVHLETREFEVGTQSSSGSGSSGGSSSSSSDSGVSLGVGNPVPEISYTPLSVTNVKQGGQAEVSLELVNTGTAFLNNCRLSSTGEYDGWISNGQVYSLSPGQKASYDLEINVPIDAESGIISIDLFATCNEFASIIPLPLEIKSSSFEFKFLEYERIGDEFRFNYQIANRLRDEQSIRISYTLENAQGVRSTTGEDQITLAAERTEEKTLIFKLPKDTFGEYTLHLIIESSSDFYQTSQAIILPSRGATGFAVSEGNRKTLSFMGIIVVVLASMLFVMRFLKKHNKKTDLPVNGRQFINLDLQQEKDNFK